MDPLLSQDIFLKELRHNILSHFFEAKITVEELGNLKIMVC